MSAPALGVELQAIFQGNDTSGSVTKAIALKGNDAPTVQLSIASSGTASSEDFATCPIALYVDGVYRDLSLGTDSTNATITTEGDTISIGLSNDVVVTTDVRRSAVFGCNFDGIRTFLPENAGSTVRGLFGTPNGQVSDDWVTRDGTILPAPVTDDERLFAGAYNYCTTNWCIRNAADSLFTYGAGTSFSTYDKCDVAYGTAPDLAGASSSLRGLCGSDASCLVDGIVGDVSDAQTAVLRQAEDEEIEVSGKPLRVRPSFGVEGSDRSIRIVVDLSTRRGARVGFFSHFNVFRYNETSESRVGEVIASLYDTGSAITLDDNVGDKIWSNQVAMSFAGVGDTLSLVAIPVNKRGKLLPNHEFAVVALGALSTYSAEANLTVVDSEKRMVTVQSFDEMELLIVYKWAQDAGDDVNTATSFINGTLGPACSGIDAYINTTQEVAYGPSAYTVRVALGTARSDSAWGLLSESAQAVSVLLHADWAGADNKGPATVRMVVRNATSLEEVPDSGIGKLITPGVQDSCATTEVVEVTVNEVNDAIFTIMLD